MTSHLRIAHKTSKNKIRSSDSYSGNVEIGLILHVRYVEDGLISEIQLYANVLYQFFSQSYDTREIPEKIWNLNYNPRNYNPHNYNPHNYINCAIFVRLCYNCIIEVIDKLVLRSCCPSDIFAEANSIDPVILRTLNL